MDTVKKTELFFIKWLNTKADPVYARLLIGMGFRHLSMSPFAIPEVKGRLREISCLEAAEMVEEVLRQATLEEVEDYVNEFMKRQKATVWG